MTSRTIAISSSALRQGLLALTAISALSLGACSKIDMPSHMTPNRIQIVTENHSQTYRVADLTTAQFDEMANHYSRYGSGQAEIIVGYDPRSKKNTAMMATDRLHRISDELSKRGVKNIKSSIQALEDSGDQSEMIIGYTSVTAQAPEDCTSMQGYEASQAAIDDNYEMGCSVETFIARQVAHPADLAGRAPDTDADGRRAGVTVEPYRSGTLPALSGGYSSTGN